MVGESGDDAGGGGVSGLTRHDQDRLALLQRFPDAAARQPWEKIRCECAECQATRAGTVVGRRLAQTLLRCRRCVSEWTFVYEGALVGSEQRVQCPECGQPLRIRVTGAGVERVEAPPREEPSLTAEVTAIRELLAQGLIDVGQANLMLDRLLSPPPPIVTTSIAATDIFGAGRPLDRLPAGPLLARPRPAPAPPAAAVEPLPPVSLVEPRPLRPTRAFE